MPKTMKKFLVPVICYFCVSVIIQVLCVPLITLSELLEQGRRFSHPNLVGYTQMVLDEARDQLLVGGQDALFRLSLEDLNVLELEDWASSQENMQTCTSSGQNEETCHNFVRVLLVHGDDEVFTCGTNAFNPNCTWRAANNLNEVKSTISGKAICPYSPLHNTTALMTHNGELYSATIIDKLARDPSINRNLGTSPSLRTDQHNSKWLNEPNFVSTYEFGNYVYFFFREIAVEYINCGKKVYSRAARVCKTDRGGSVLLEGKWTTFHKARLNCSMPGVFPFYFDELQSTFYSPDEGLVYAIFSTPPNSIAGSAVCAYNMTSFEAAFNGPFKHQENPMSAWMKQENGNSESRKCMAESGGQKRSSEKSADHLVMAQRYQLMDHAVQPLDHDPIIMREHERWTHLVVDHVPVKTDQILDVFFLATDDGKVQKMMRLPHTPTPITCLVENIKIVPNGKPRPVKAMVLSPFLGGKGAIYLSTNGNILKVPVQRCSRFKDSSACIGARDPYCGWNMAEKACTTPPNGNPHDDNWEQDVSACPSLDMPEDGRWSEWSDWSKCQQVGGDPTVDQCLCRSRSCDNPKPTNGGRPCQGSGIVVANCTVHGSWTEWSEWSSCSQTCGFAIRERKRQCGNPPPKFGGRLCQGQDSDKQYCNDNPDCPLPPVDGRWADWSGWSSCTKDCNGGIQTRRRGCSQPAPMRGGQNCDGNKQEWRMCNTQDCDEIARISPWTEWIQTNRTTGGYFEQRFRFTCRASVPKRKLIKTSFAKSQARFCHVNGKGCQTAADTEDAAAENITSVDGGWSSWVEWSDCTSRCEGGLQWRNRTCDNPDPSGPLAEACQGHGREERACNIFSCWGSWSCWSPFTPCTVTCGTGVKTRSRSCQRSKVGMPCTGGHSVESEPCQAGDCVTLADVTSAVPTTSQPLTTTTTTATTTTTKAAVKSKPLRDGGQDCSGSTWSDWTPCKEEGGDLTGVQYRHRLAPKDGAMPQTSKTGDSVKKGPETECQQQVQMRACGAGMERRLDQNDAKVGAVLSSADFGGSFKTSVPIISSNVDDNDDEDNNNNNVISNNNDDYNNNNMGNNYNNDDNNSNNNLGNNYNNNQNNNVGASRNHNPYYGETAREIGVVYLIVTSLVSFVIGGLASVGLYIYFRQYRKQRRQEEALWTTSFTSATSDIFASNGPFTEQAPTPVIPPPPKMNNLEASQQAQGLQEMTMLSNNLNELSYSDAFGSLRKGKVTVNEAETMKRNSMWTDFSTKDDKF